jgi:hypothetical protein
VEGIVSLDVANSSTGGNVIADTSDLSGLVKSWKPDEVYPKHI